MFTDISAQIVTLFKITKKCKQPKYPLIEEWINVKKIYIINKIYLFHKIEYYSDISNEILLHATTCLKNWKFYACMKTARHTGIYFYDSKHSE